METIGERIRRLRKELNLTLEKFGHALGVGKSAINKLETGENKVTDQMKKSICRTWNVSELWLDDGIGDMFLSPEEDTALLVSDLLEDSDNEFYQSVLELVRTYKQLSPESRTVLKEFGKMYLENMKTRNE